MGLGGIHGEALWRDYESQVLDGVRVECTFIEFGVKVVFAEPLEDAAYVFLVFRFVVGEHENVV